jgi:phosphonate transport system substrate-binding protein
MTHVPSRRALLVTTLATALLSLPAAAQTLTEINFGILSTETQQNLKPRYAAFVADMEKQLGLKVNAFFAPDYAGIIEAMRFGKVQIAWMGNASAIIAVDRANAEVFAQNVAADGSPGYYSHVIVNKESPIKDFDDLLRSPGKYSFSNGDPNSTSGFLVPSYYAWALNNIDVKKHFTRVISGNHEVNALAVANRQVDVATVSSEAIERLAQTSPDKEKLLRAIWKSPLIPLDPMLWRADVPASVKDKVRDFFLTYGQMKAGKAEAQLALEKAVLANLQTSEFRASSNKQLVPLRQIGLFRDKLKIEADDKMSAEEKATKIREIDAKLAQLQREIGS